MQSAPYKPCVIIPVYNHPLGIQGVCDALALHALPCVLVDDGSDAACRETLDDLIGLYNWLHLIRFKTNRGKGAAVCAGLAWAGEQGFTHALQVDADGQHDLADIPRFIERSQQSPEAVVTGSRVAEGISAARHYGRKLTDWLVWLETLSTHIEDSMCGYRLYPLAATLPLIQSRTIGERMDFDTDILVRLSWRGVPVQQVTTRVIYRDGIPSHFRMIRDNVRMTRLHIMLVLGMLLRAPVLIGRKLRDP